MGLDMYLSKKTYVQNWSHMKPAEKHKITITKGGKLVSTIDTAKITYITEDIGYWRKANAIHKFFVDNAQDGDDDCNDYNVSEEVLKDLLDRCKTIVKESVMVSGKIQNGTQYTKNGHKPIMEKGKYIKNPEIASELLPCQEGFFFGQTNYDEYYMQDIKDTIKICKQALKAIEDGADIYYQASWQIYE